MRVLKRILIKLIILLFVVGLFGGGAAGWQAYRQSTSAYAIENYLSKLIDDSSDKAYLLLDQSEDTYMTAADYKMALEEKQYSLYSEYNMYEMEKRRDNNGQEYVDYRIEFLDAAQTVQLEENFTVKKQAEPIFGIFDEWKVLSGHCLVKDFLLTVPAGAEVYLNSAPVETGWIVRDGIPMSYDCYKVPGLLPGNISVVVRHPILESVNATVDASEKSADYSVGATLKASAQDELKELAVKALKAVYTAAASEKMEGFEACFEHCMDSAEKIAEDQAKKFHRENAQFKSAAISGFDAQFGELTFTEEETGAITAEIKFSYHYDVREEVTTDTGEYYEDGTSIQETAEEIVSGNAEAAFVMSYYEGTWHIVSVEMDMIP